MVPISLAATSLPARFSWLTVAMCGAGYALLWWRSVPLPPVHTRFGDDFDLHLAGMWVNFVIAAVLIAVFVGRMARLVRQRDRELAAMRESSHFPIREFVKLFADREPFKIAKLAKIHRFLKVDLGVEAPIVPADLGLRETDRHTAVSKEVLFEERPGIHLNEICHHAGIHQLRAGLFEFG